MAWIGVLREGVIVDGRALAQLAREAVIDPANLRKLVARGTGLSLASAERLAHVLGLDLLPSHDADRPSPAQHAVKRTLEGRPASPAPRTVDSSSPSPDRSQGKPEASAPMPSVGERRRLALLSRMRNG